jgi:hypothetical protein
MRRFLLAALLGAALTSLGCHQRPSPEQCDTLCWRFAELEFWSAFDKQAEGLGDEDRATLKAQRQTEWDELRKATDNKGRDNCVMACRRNGEPKQVACVTKATTVSEAEACMK